MTEIRKGRLERPFCAVFEMHLPLSPAWILVVAVVLALPYAFFTTAIPDTIPVAGGAAIGWSLVAMGWYYLTRWVKRGSAEPERHESALRGAWILLFLSAGASYVQLLYS